MSGRGVDVVRAPWRLRAQRPSRRLGGETGRVGLAVVAVGLALLFHVLSGDFLTWSNANTILLNSAMLLIAGIAAGALLISGNVDLSIGGIVAVVAIVSGTVARDSQSALEAVLIGVAVGAALGMVNGLLVQLLSISPLIVTLGTAAVFRGMAYVLSDGSSIFGFPQPFVDLGQERVAGVSLQVWIALAFFTLGGFVLMRTVYGVRTFAIGGNPEGARLAGINIRRHVVSLYAFSGLACGLVGVLTTAQLASASATIGTQFELDVLTAVILGGIGFAGGSGRPIGIFVGVMTIGILDAGLIYAGVPDFWQQVSKGAVLLLALGSDQIAAHLRARREVEEADDEAAEREQADVAVGSAPLRDGTTANGSAGAAAHPVVFEVEHLQKRYGSVRAVRDANFVARAGEILCLLGDNGAGKSSVIKCISGVVRADGGTMTLDGERYDPSSPGDARRRGVETVYQDLALCSNLGASLNLALGEEPRKGRLGVLSLMDFKRAAVQATERLGAFGVRLPDLNRAVSGLSGGQRQAIAIARVAASDVRMVILDEPTAALGVKQSARVLALCRTLASRGIAVILITHDVEAVLGVADKVVVLRLGANLYTGEIERVDQSDLIHLMAGVLPTRIAAETGGGAVADPSPA